MAVRFAFVSADTNVIIPADTNVIRRMLRYPHQWNRWLLLLWLLLVGGFRSLCMHGHQVRVCVSWTQTRYQLTQTRYRAFRLQWNRWLLWLWLLLLASSGRISFPLHSWPLGSRLCQPTQTRYQLTGTNAIRRMLGYPHQWNRWLLLL